MWFVLFPWWINLLFPLPNAWNAEKLTNHLIGQYLISEEEKPEILWLVVQTVYLPSRNHWVPLAVWCFLPTFLEEFWSSSFQISDVTFLLLVVLGQSSLRSFILQMVWARNWNFWRFQPFQQVSLVIVDLNFVNLVLTDQGSVFLHFPKSLFLSLSSK